MYVCVCVLAPTQEAVTLITSELVLTPLSTKQAHMYIYFIHYIMSVHYYQNVSHSIGDINVDEVR
jgi:hypothetical protein